MALQEINDLHEFEGALKAAGRKLIVVCFTSGNCGPCRITSPVMEQMSKEMPDVQFMKVDVQKDDEFVEHFKISGVPAFLFYKNYQVVYNFQGGNMNHLKQMVEELRFK
ncbi:thioredoxin-like [Pseudophryne corroboree]|uniref:thioredoxin-like n=1 Tax=Pseudophryne corroboree TaxID=495146 RepID=UPI0030820AF0